MDTGTFALLGHSIGCLIAVGVAKRAREEEVEAEPEAPPEPSDEVKLLSEIRDLMAKQS